MKPLSPELQQQFDLEKQWKKYLQLNGLDESRMARIQIQETRRAFFGGFGMGLVLLSDEVTELDENDDQDIQVIDYLMKQVTDFWQMENLSHEIQSIIPKKR